MPELPEVETIRRGLESELVGRRIDGVDWRPARLRGGPSPRPLAAMEGTRVVGLRRHGKFLMTDLSDGSTWLVHLGMTGKLLFAQPGEHERAHTHLVLNLDDERQLRYTDPRRFGLLKLYDKGAVIPDLDHYGIDALDPALDDARMAQLLASSGAPLKAFLLDQTKLAGVGNIYACEALWRSGLSPRRRANATPRARVPLLRSSIVDVLRDSLAQGGTSFNDYVDHIGRPGEFVAALAVFQREGEPCPTCASPIRRIVQSGRSTFYCPTCQR